MNRKRTAIQLALFAALGILAAVLLSRTRDEHEQPRERSRSGELRARANRPIGENPPAAAASAVSPLPSVAGGRGGRGYLDVSPAAFNESPNESSAAVQSALLLSEEQWVGGRGADRSPASAIPRTGPAVATGTTLVVGTWQEPPGADPRESLPSADEALSPRGSRPLLDAAAGVEPSPEVIPAGNGSDAWKLEVTPEGDDALSIQITNADFREVLAQLSEQGGLNLLATKSATAKISASLVAVDVETALDAILKSAGYVARRDGAFIYVGPPADFKELEQAWDQIGTRVYRPNYVTALEIQTLITPLLSPNVGKSSVTTASDEGIGADSATAGGESYANGAAVVVQDYERVLALVDELVAEVDVRPMQVSIEAMILSVRLDDTHRFGINFQLFRDKDHLIVSSGSPLASLTDLALDGGLKLAFLDSSLSAFLEALETVGDTNVIATPSLMCLNKQRAEILIGAQLGYISTTLTETSTAQNVEFLEVGAALRLRPFISRDGLIRLEVHPELSTGNVRVEGGFTLPDKELTQVTTNIMVRDGCTVVIGGLMREDLSTSTTQIPYLGSLPVVGGLFRQRDQTLERREILILVTPSIVYEPEVCMEGEAGAAAFHHRQAVKADSMSPLATRYLSRKNLRLAEEYAAAGRVEMARRRAELAVHYDPNNLAAIQFRDSLGPGGSTRTAIGPPLMPPTEGDALDGDTISPWILDELEGQSGMPEAAFPHPRDPGLTGRVRSVGPAPWGSQRLGLEGEGAGP